MAALNQNDFTALDVIEYFVFLDELRDTGDTNMYGAAPYLVRSFPELDMREARLILKAWNDTFDGDADAEDRAYIALGEEE